MNLQYHYNSLDLDVKEFGAQCMSLSFILKKFQIFMSKVDFITVGVMTIVS